jgi:hypothetical protein
MFARENIFVHLLNLFSQGQTSEGGGEKLFITKPANKVIFGD